MEKFKNIQNKSFTVIDDGKEKIVWENRSPAICGVLVAKHKEKFHVLISQRGEGAFDNRGRWNFPCGYLDWNEDGYEAICREVYEETGVYIPDVMKNYKVINKFFDQPFYTNTKPTANRQNVSFYYGMYFEADELPEVTDENSEEKEVGDIKWIDIDDIHKYDMAYNHAERLKIFIGKI